MKAKSYAQGHSAHWSQNMAPLEEVNLYGDSCGVCLIDSYCVKHLKKPYLFYSNLWIPVHPKVSFRKAWELFVQGDNI